MSFASAEAAIDATTYPFTTVTGGFLQDMTGSTVVIAELQDDVASGVIDIGFDFWFDGARYTQFSVNSNGLVRLGAAAVSTASVNSLASVGDSPKITPYWDDICTGHIGNIRYKLFGTAPNRKLVIEWNHVVTDKPEQFGCANDGPSVFELWLFETTGVIESIYNSTQANTTGYSVGFQSGADTNYASVNTSNNTCSYTRVADGDAVAITGRAYIFTPNVPAAPTNLTFTGVTPTSMTLNWIDNATNEFGYAIFRSTDNVNFTMVAQTAANATSQIITGLTPSTNYFFRVNAVTEGAVSSALTGNQTTLVPGNKLSVVAGGLWSSPATWSPAGVPNIGDHVTIVDGSTVTIDTAAFAYIVTVGAGDAGATLQFEQTTARTLTVDTNVTITRNGTLQSNQAGTQKGTSADRRGRLDQQRHPRFPNEHFRWCRRRRSQVHRREQQHLRRHGHENQHPHAHARQRHFVQQHPGVELRPAFSLAASTSMGRP